MSCCRSTVWSRKMFHICFLTHFYVIEVGFHPIAACEFRRTINWMDDPFLLLLLLLLLICVFSHVLLTLHTCANRMLCSQHMAYIFTHVSHLRLFSSLPQRGLDGWSWCILGVLLVWQPDCVQVCFFTSPHFNIDIWSLSTIISHYRIVMLTYHCSLGNVAWWENGWGQMPWHFVDWLDLIEMIHGLIFFHWHQKTLLIVRTVSLHKLNNIIYK